MSDYHTIFNKISNKNPVIHHIMNTVTMHFVANGINALGGSPVMAKHSVETKEVTQKADALVLNLGTPDADTEHAMMSAIESAKKRSIPIVFDPVGIGVSSYRKNIAQTVLKSTSLSAICANASELHFLLSNQWGGRGVDANEYPTLFTDAVSVAKALKTIVVVTGEVDLITDGNHVISSRHGSPLLPSISGTGCLLTSIIALFLSVSERGDALSSVVLAVRLLGLAGEWAETEAKGPGSFASELLDALFTCRKSPSHLEGGIVEGTEWRRVT